ncbi:fatty acid synthase-like [Oppia nitens]|uniref:fatty acid synthase-like n=1 Tax=Oppia nitens TaxID=1686743 RepID=UPI0023DBA167|nr:fatty acid synthase-like [Oppia nitens]
MNLNEHFVDNDDDIVISGLAGRFPESDTLDELSDNLLANKDLISEDARRWPPGLYGLPTRSGKLKSLDKFDAQFFGLNGKQADYMDPQGRILLEVTYEAMVDSGWNPASLRGTNTAVFVGAFLTESEESLASNPSKVMGYGATGTKRNMLSNRVSYAFDLRGPSLSLDTACSSSMVGLQLAFSGMRANEFDMAIVAGVNVNLRPATALEFHKLNMLSIDGKCKYLDESANGYVRSETVSVLLLQKRRNARRVYATVIHAKTNSDGNKAEGITYPSAKSQTELMEATLKESGVKPDWVRYVEAHGTGTSAGDMNESNAIYNVYGKERSDPLLVGSVKSNLGHTESSSGMCSLAKVVIAFERMKIPASLHLQRPNPKIVPLIEGHLLPITENQPFEDSVVPVNSFGFGGTNVHVLVRPQQLAYNYRKQGFVDEIPRLILVNGRTENSVNHIMDFIVANKDKADDDFLTLLSAVTTDGESNGMDYNGYMIRDVSAQSFEERERTISKVGDRRPVWFVFSGMGTQWTAMARGLMKIEIFNRSIRQSADILEEYDIELLKLILEDNDDLLMPILSSSVGIAAIQIALVDLLRALDIKPDGFLGHSSGELACGYADGSLTARETILYAYWRGRCVEQGKLPKGLMAAVGLTWEEANRRCPSGVVAACHNAVDSVTISGAYDSVDKFLAKLKAENIFTKTVNSCDIPFHSSYMKLIAPDMIRKLTSVGASKRLRSSRWISSSVPQDKWSTPESQYSTPEYYVNNLTSPVLFDEAVRLMPKNAIIVEVAPDSLFRNVIKRSLGTDCTYLGLMKRNSADSLRHLLSTIGSLYSLGLKPKISKLYPKIAYPVKRGTQSLGSLVRWDHSDSWLVTLYPDYFNNKSQSELTIEVDFSKQENKFYLDHCIDGRLLFPAIGYLDIVWQEFAKQQSTSWDQLPVIIENCRIIRPTIMRPDSQLTFKLNLSQIDGQFYLYENQQLSVTGRIRVPKKGEKFLPLHQKYLNSLKELADVVDGNGHQLDKQSVYKELRIRGYHYDPQFQLTSAVDVDKGVAKIQLVDNNVVTFGDAMLHSSILQVPTRDLYLPTGIQSFHCDPRILLAKQADREVEDNSSALLVLSNLTANYLLANGLEFHGIETRRASRRQQTEELLLEKYVWLPYMDNNSLQPSWQQLCKSYIELTDELVKNRPQKSSSKLSEMKDRFSQLLTANQLNDDRVVLKKAIESLSLTTIAEPLSSKPFVNDLSADFLNNVYFDETLLRPAVDIVLENSVLNGDLNVLEINPNQSVCHQRIIHYLKDSFYGQRIKYSVYNPFGIQTTSDTDIDNLPYDPIDINLSMQTKMVQTNPYQLIIIREQYAVHNGNKERLIKWEDIMRFVKTNLDINGFVLVLKRTQYTKAEKTVLSRFGYNESSLIESNSLIELIQNFAGLSLVSNRSDSQSATATSAVMLFRKLDASQPSLANDIIVRVSHNNNENLKQWLDQLKDELNNKSDQNNNNSLIWLISDITEDSDTCSGIVGLVNCLRREPNGHRVRCISALEFDDLEMSRSVGGEVDFKELVHNSIFENNLVMNIYRKGQLGSYRHLSIGEESLTKVQCRHASIDVSAKQSNPVWLESKHNLWPENKLSHQNNKILINVYYGVINAVTTDNDNGVIKPSIGPNSSAATCLQFSGVVDSTGDRVFGIHSPPQTSSANISTTLVVDDKESFMAVPDNWSLEEACTVPEAYGSAYWALIENGRLLSKHTVVIHGANRPNGRAALAVCLSRKCRVFCTVDSHESMAQLLADFSASGLSPKNIINTAADCFKQEIIDNTDGIGVDIIYDSNVANDIDFNDSIACLKQKGCYISLGYKNNFAKNGFISDKNITIMRINLNDIFFSQQSDADNNNSLSDKQKVFNYIRDGIRDNVVKPFKDRHIFTIDNIAGAVKYMNKTTDDGVNNNSKQQQVVLVVVQNETNNNNLKKSQLMVKAVHNTQFPSNGSMIITGGLGGFGLELAYWLVERGVRQLVLTSRSGVKNQFQEFTIKQLRKLGANVVISTLDASDERQCDQLIKEANTLAPVYGIFSLAMVLSDGLLANQTPESLLKVFAPKVKAITIMDTLSRVLCPNLHYFVAFSSVTSGRGNAGQCNYGYANSYMERLCEQRTNDGLPGLAVQWGAIDDVGVVADMSTTKEQLTARGVGGTVPQRIHSCLSLMNHFLRSDKDNSGVVSSLLRKDVEVVDSVDKKDIKGLVAFILGIRDVSKIKDQSKLSDLGMDSLMVVEIKQALEREFQVILSLKELTEITFGSLDKLSAK